jgi:hypothetical protein
MLKLKISTDNEFRYSDRRSMNTPYALIFEEKILNKSIMCISVEFDGHE